MPWNPRFNYVLGGAGAGMAQLGRGATLAQVLAAAAMGSTEAQQNLYDQEQKRAQFEERLRQEIEDRKMRQEEHDLRVKEYQDRQTAIANEAKAAETTATENSRQAAEDVKFLLENNITPTAHPDVNKELVKALSTPKKPEFTSEQMYQHGRDAIADQRRTQEEADKEQNDLYNSYNAGLDRPRKQAEDWQRSFEDNRKFIAGNEQTKEMTPAQVDELAKQMTIAKYGPEILPPSNFAIRPDPHPNAGLKINAGPSAGRKAPPKDEQPFPSGLTGLPPTGSAVASPTGATAPPSIVPKRNIAPAPAMLNNLSAAIDAAIPDMDQRTKISAEAKIKLDMLQDPTITPDEAIRQLKEQWNHYRFQMRGYPDLMGTPGGGR